MVATLAHVPWPVALLTHPRNAQTVFLVLEYLAALRDERQDEKLSAAIEAIQDAFQIRLGETGPCSWSII